MSLSFVRLALYGLAAAACFGAQAADFASWLDRQLLAQPAVIAEQQRLLAARAEADGLAKPLYNPVLSAFGEKNGNDNNVALGLEQTLDWWGQGDSQQQEARLTRVQATLALDARLQQQKAKVLAAMARFLAAADEQQLAQQQRRYLGTLLALVKKRQVAGDLGVVDAELARLNLSSRLKALADADAAYEEARAEFEALLPNASVQKSVELDGYLARLRLPEGEEWLARHPAVALAKARWQLSRQQVETRRRAVKAKPTVGLSAGRDGGSSSVEVGVSIPLNLRNDFQSDVAATNHQALASEAAYQQQYLNQRAAWRAAKGRLASYQRHYRQWQQWREQDVQPRLERFWQQGELATAQYLQGLNALAQSQSDGIALEQQTRLALIDALAQSGQLSVKGVTL
ncbi:TolC family protein [Gallaecimonas pentaromativorans]|uniref:TolC family protein n=1 Tax=Gallaecimonas pentaromativorans TaxID=584787 RepID=UPI003A8D303D